MSEREARVFWVKRTNQKDILVFDAGYEGGTLYIYEFKESVQAEEVMKASKNVEQWIEKTYGMPTMAWKIIQR